MWNYIITTFVLYWILKEVWIRVNLKPLKNEIILITGGAMGIGKLMAERFAKAGARIVLWDMNKTALEETAKELKQTTGNAISTYVVDITDKTAVYSVADQVRRDVGDVTILINNAGIVSGKKLLDCTDAQIERTMAVNVTSHHWTVRSFLPHMLQRDRGHIVTIASAAGLSGTAGLTDYCASKFAAVGFAEALRLELKHLGKKGVDSLIVCPFFIKTGMFEGVKTRFSFLLPLLEPEYVADKIVNSIRRRDSMLIMPRFLNLAVGLKGILPIEIIDWLCEFLGVSSSMDEFKGRGPAPASKKAN